MSIASRRRAIIAAQKSGAKTENFVKIGDPQISDGILHTTENDWIAMPSAFDPGTAPWEFVVKFKRYLINDYQTIVLSDGISYRSAWSSNNIKSYLRSANETGSNWDIDDGTRGANCPLNTWEWLKTVFDGGKYSYYRSEDGANWIAIGSPKNNANPIKPGVITFGPTLSATRIANADFDLSETYITVNGSPYWSPYI